MAQPTEYHREFNFTNYQAVNPSRPLPAQHVDAEYNRIKQTTDEIINNLGLIQRDDGDLANETVGYDQLKAELFLGMEPPTVWITAEAYTLTDTVIYDAGLYRCVTAHTSGTFATDLAAGKWALLVDFTQQLDDAIDVLLTGQVGLIDTRSAIEGLTVPAEANVLRTAGYSVVGDGGAALYKRVGSEPSHPGKVQSDDGAWWELAEPVLRPEMFGAAGDGTTDDTPAFRNALLAAAAMGSNRVELRAKTYGIGIDDVTAFNSTGISNGEYGLLVLGPVQVVGQGYNSVLKRITLDTEYVTVVVPAGTGAAVRNLRIDGNKPDGGTGEAYDSGSGMIIEALSNAENTDTLIEDLWVENCAGYGIGAEWGNKVGLTLRRIRIRNTGCDGIDIKRPNSGSQYVHAVILDDIYIENFGQTASDSAQAGIDIRGYTLANNIYVRNYGADGRAGIRMRGGIVSDNSIGAQQAVLSNFRCEKGDGGAANTYGVEINADDVQVVGGSVYGVTYGVGTLLAGSATSVARVKITAVSAMFCTGAGFIDLPDAALVTYDNCSAFGCEIGAYIRGASTTLIGFTGMSSTSTHIFISDEASNPAVISPRYYASGRRLEDRIGKVETPDPTLFDDFTGAVLDNQWLTHKGSDAEALLPAQTAGGAGRVRLTTGNDAGGTMALNGSQLSGAIAWRPLNGGPLTMEVRLQMSAASAVAVFVGFTDQVSVLEMPFTLAAGNTLTSNATDAVGVLYDTDGGSGAWRLVGVDSDVDAAHVGSGIAPAEGVFERWRIEVATDGTASFYHNGEYQAALSAAITPGGTYAPVIAAFSRAAGSRNIDVDYVYVNQRRA